jgi:hypothetical protein
MASPGCATEIAVSHLETRERLVSGEEISMPAPVQENRPAPPLPTNRPVSGPFSVMKVTGYRPVPGALGRIPLAADWKQTANADRPSECGSEIISLIERYLTNYHQNPDWWGRLSALGQIYFLTDRWLRNARPETDPGTSAQKPAFDLLLRTVADRLCVLLDCSINHLPDLIEQYWGLALKPQGVEMDRQDAGNGYAGDVPTPDKLSQVADYMMRAELQQYRLFFQNGKVFQIPWWRAHGPYAPVLADSRKVSWINAKGISMTDSGYAGFALSMGHDFYMARQPGGYDRHNIFPSSLAGDTVLCTGTLRIENGRVKGVCNDGGNYQVSVDHLINVVQALEIYDIPPCTYEVRAVAGSWRDANGITGTYDRVWTGDELLRYGGRGWDVRGKHKASVFLA